VKSRKVIKNLLESNHIFLMLKGTPQQPRCGFSKRAVHVLEQYGLSYNYFNVFDDVDLMQLIKDYTDWPTTPQLFVEGQLIGGCDIIEQLHAEGKLQSILSGSEPIAIN